MNKNIIKLFAILMMCFMIGSVLVACSAGKDGADGADGAPGAEGPQGPQGPAGESAYIGENGNWWVGDTDTGVKAEGEDLRDCENHDYWNAEIEADNKIVYSVHTQDSLGCTLWVCVDCGDSYIEWVDHEYTKVVTAPTCTAKGYTTYTCDCGYTFVADETDMVAHSWGDWEDSLYADTFDGCPCECPTIYVRNCTVCGVRDTDTKTDPAPGHKFNTWKPSINQTTVSPCEQIPLEVSYCDVCKHEECNQTRPAGEGVAPGHKWGAWTVVTEPTADSKGLIKKVCSECGASYASGVKTAELPALNKTDYTYAVVTAPDCDTKGQDSYTYVIEGQSIVIKVDVAATGHTYEGSTEITITVAPTLTTTGVVTVGCVDCDHTATAELPAVGTSPMYGRFIIKMGNCLEPIDTYCMPIDVDGNQVFVTFEVDGGYQHDEQPADNELVVLEGDGKWYYAYWCTKCNHWIIVDSTDVNPNA